MSSSQPQHVWYYQKSTLLGVSDEGPFTDGQLLQIAKDNQLTLATPIRSPTRTKNQWIKAESVQALAVVINQAKLDHQKKVAADKAEKQAVKERARAERLAAEKPGPEKAEQGPSESDLNALAEKIKSQVSTILTSGEVIDFVVAQAKPIMIKADAAVCTNRRLIIYRPKMLGRFDFDDYLWRDLADAHIKQGIIGSTFMAKHVSGSEIAIEWLPKDGAKRLYQFAQEQEEKAFHTRRQMAMEESAAGAAKINVGIPAVSAPPVAASSAGNQSPVQKLQQLKEMLDAGLITSEEFAAKKQEILGTL